MSLVPTQTPLTTLLSDQKPLISPEQSCQSKLMVIAHSVNPIIAASTPLMRLINHCTIHPTTQCSFDQLHHSLLHELKACERQLWRHHLPTYHIYAARIFLCAWMDEVLTAPNQPHAHIWKKRPFSKIIKLSEPSHFVAFNILQHALTQPTATLPLLEFIYLCISMGYTRLFHHQAHPTQTMNTCKNKLYQAIRQQRDHISHTAPTLLITSSHTPSSTTHQPMLLLTGLIGLLLTLNLAFANTSIWKITLQHLAELNI